MTQDKGYVDSQYLLQLAALLENAKRASYQRIRVMEGSRVLDVGCGPGTDTIALAKLVGSRGRVVGVDHNAAMIEQANSRAIENGVSGWCEHRVADSASLSFDDGSFDAARAERLFQHLRNPAPTFREMLRVTRAGGYIVVLDTDYTTVSVAVDEHELERRFARVTVEHSVNNGYAAREMPLLFQNHDLNEIDVEVMPFLYTDYALAREWGRFDETEQLALETGAFNQQELEHWHASCERAADNGSFLTQVNLVIVSGRTK